MIFFSYIHEIWFYVGLLVWHLNLSKLDLIGSQVKLIQNLKYEILIFSIKNQDYDVSLRKWLFYNNLIDGFA